jgi:hypothetical protein
VFSYVYCKCFSWMCCICLHRLYACFKVISGIFQVFQTYVVIVLSRCCKSRSGVAYVVIGPTYRSHLLQLLGRYRGSPSGRLRPVDASVARQCGVHAVECAKTGSMGFFRARHSLPREGPEASNILERLRTSGR